VTVYAAVLRVELHVPAAHSLKDKRAVIKPIVEGARRRFAVAASETGFVDKWQRAELGVAAVGSSQGHVTATLDNVERWIWSHTEIVVTDTERRWLDHE
jgi:uncharacterized protein